jgi:hypothetical protein
MTDVEKLTDKEFFELVANETYRRRTLLSEEDPKDDHAKRSLWLDMLDCGFYATQVFEQL